MKTCTGRRALCLCVLVLSITGFTAGSANAADWMTNGSNLAEGFLPYVEIKGHGTLLFLVFKIHVDFLCTTVRSFEVHLYWKIIPYILGGLQEHECKLNILKGSTKEIIGECEVWSSGQEPGVVNSNELEGELTLVEKEGVIVLKPKVGEIIETLVTSEECPLPEEIPLYGKLALKDVGGTSNLEKEAKVHTLVEGPGTEMWVVSNTAEHKATLGGEFATSFESGGTWSGLPE